MTVKFNEKNLILLGALQNGTKPASPKAKDGLAFLDGVAEITRETETYEYKGDSLSRREFTTLKDTFVEVSAQTLMPILGTLDPAIDLENAPLYPWITSCGANATKNAAGAVTYANDKEVEKLLTVDYYKTSPEATPKEDVKQAKLQRFTNCRGMLDISFETTARAKLDFKFLGNDTDPVAAQEMIPNLDYQIGTVASVVRKENMQYGVIKEIVTSPTVPVAKFGTFEEFYKGIEMPVTDEFLIGETVAVTRDTLPTEFFIIIGRKISGTKLLLTAIDETDDILIINGKVQTYDGVSITIPIYLPGSSVRKTTATVVKRAPKRLCPSAVTFTNFFGFDYERFLVTCEEGFSKQATGSDLSLTILEDEVSGEDFSPKTSIENFFSLSLKYGTAEGEYVEFAFEKIQLINTAETKISRFFGEEMSFRNTGISKLIFS